MEKKKHKENADDALDELTTRAEENTSDAANADNSQAADTDATDDKAAKKDATTSADSEKKLRHEREERARKAFKQLTDIDDEGESSMSLRGILGGDILGSRTFRKQILYITMLCVMAVIYVANRYAFQHEEIRREELARDLADRKFKALTVAAELTEFSMRSNVEENLPDTTLRTSTKASYYLHVDEDDTISIANE